MGCQKVPGLAAKLHGRHAIVSAFNNQWERGADAVNQLVMAFATKWPFVEHTLTRFVFVDLLRCLCDTNGKIVFDFQVVTFASTDAQRDSSESGETTV